MLVARPAAARLVAALSNHLVAITTGFSGSSVLLFGAVDAPADVIVVVRGPEEVATVHRKRPPHGHLGERGRDVVCRRARILDDGGDPSAVEILADSVAEFHQIGLDHLRLVPQEPSSARRIAEFRAALIRTRQREELYGTAPSAISFLGNRLFRTDLWIPANAPIGTYTVSVFLVRDGDVISAETTPLVVGKVGFEARVFQLAHQFSLLYGIVAVLLAAMAGWIANLVFRKD
ncbi:MAG: TIGR02186 family protein [Rhodospirillales bacterium]